MINEIYERKLYLNKTLVYWLIGYYLFIFLFGFIGAISVLGNLCNRYYCFRFEDHFMSAMLGSAFIAISSASVAYMRKVYKECFISSDNQHDSNSELVQLGTAIYFFTRPFFAAIFSLLIVLGVYGGLIGSTAEFDLDKGYTYLCMFLSFNVGFFSGKFIDRLEDLSDSLK